MTSLIPKAKILDIMDGLVKKTRQGHAKWVEGTTLQGHPLHYRLQLLRSSVSLTYYSSDAAPDLIDLKMVGPDGRVVGSWTAEEGGEGWTETLNLFSEVHKYVTKWDKVLEEVEKFISSSP